MKKSIAAFTLIELLVVISIAALLAVAAVPSFKSSITRNQVQTTLRDFAGHLKFARSESAATQRPVVVCHLSGSTCDGDWSKGWTVFYDDNGDETLNDTIDKLKVHAGIGRNQLTVVDDKSPADAQDLIVFDPLGRVGSRLTVQYCDAAAMIGAKTKSITSRALIIENTGVAMFSRVNASGFYRDINGSDLEC